ncbi:hypothetical protein DL770_003593 [Monosporascus sp. CRB-9-2]|nr:hypothetical protein DL770_003593 [Monosporascus sp. CRB-9-2]
MLFLRLTHLTSATPGNTAKDSIETKEKTSRRNTIEDSTEAQEKALLRDTTKDSIEAQEKTSHTDTAMDSIETKEKASRRNTIEDSIEAQEKALPRDTTKDSIEAQQKTSPTDTIEGLIKFHITTSVRCTMGETAQSPQPMHHQYGSPPTCAGAPLPNQQRPNYKPSALRWPFLSLLFTTMVAFIGLLAYAMYALPQRDILPELINSTSKPDTVRRQVGDAIEIVDGTANSSSPGAPEGPDYSETTPEMVPTGSTGDSGDISTTGPPVITATVPLESYGDVSVTVTESTTPSARPPDSFGDVTVTETFPHEKSNSVSVSTEKISDIVPTSSTDDSGFPITQSTVALEDYNDLFVTVTESTTYASVPPSIFFGDVTVTETFPHEESNSVSVPIQTTPEMVSTRSTDDSGDISTTGPPVIITTGPPTTYHNVPWESYGDVSFTVTESIAHTRPLDSFGDITVTVTSPHKKSNSDSVSTQTIPDIVPTSSTDDTGFPTTLSTVAQGNYGTTAGTVTESIPPSTQTIPEIVPTRSTDDSGNTPTTGPPVITTAVPPSRFGRVSGTVTESAPPSTVPPENHGSISGTVTESATVLPENHGRISGTVTESDPQPTVARENHGGTAGTVTESDLATVTRENHGDTVGTVTESNSTVDPVITTVTVNPTDNRGAEVVQTLALTPTLAVETDSNGIPTTTLTKYPSFTSVIATSHTTVLTNSLGQPTRTVVTDALLTPSITVETDLNGIPTATRTSYDIIPTKEPESGENDGGNSKGGSTVVRVWRITYGEYFIGLFLPTILAMAISIPIRILDLNVKLLQPWHELTKPGGASGRRSLCLETGGLWGLINAVRWVFGGHVLIVLTTSLVLASALLVPLSAEAIAFDFQGTCVKGSGNGSGCVYVVSVFREAAGGTLALLALMAMMVFTILFYLVKWQSGVGANPWSICGIASLSLNEDVRKLFPSHVDGGAAGKAPDELMASVLKDRVFTLGYFNNSEGGLEYGIMLQENDVVEPYLEGMRDENTPPLDKPHWYNGQTGTGKKHNQPFFMLKYSGRALLLLLLCGILALILYYNNTGGETGFEYFMMSESFGVRFLFTGVGFIITLCWSSFFNSVAVLSPYHLLAKAPQPAGRSILLAPPTNAFSGLWSAVRRRDSFLAVVALTSVLSELLPVLLAEIPFHVSQTYLVHLITTWSAVGILCIMLLVLVSSFFVKWPHMPLDPTTVAGAMYYVADSWMLGLFEGLGTLEPKDRDRRVVALGLKYRFGPMTGVSWETRVGVDVAGDLSSVAGLGGC